MIFGLPLSDHPSTPNLPLSYRDAGIGVLRHRRSGGAGFGKSISTMLCLPLL